MLTVARISVHVHTQCMEFYSELHVCNSIASYSAHLFSLRVVQLPPHKELAVHFDQLPLLCPCTQPVYVCACVRVCVGVWVCVCVRAISVHVIMVFLW